MDTVVLLLAMDTMNGNQSRVKKFLILFSVQIKALCR